MHASQREAAAAKRARAALQPFLTPAPPADDIDTAAVPHDDCRGITSTNVLLISSPYPRRRATLAFVPYDKPVSATAPAGAAGKEAAIHDDPATKTNASLVKPDPLPTCVNVSRVSLSSMPPPDVALVRSIPRTTNSPYHQLSFIMEDTCTPFTALLATLRAAGFTRVSGRKALLHKTHSLLWLKHLLPSTVDQLMHQLGQYRKVNHFPGTHWLGRKDKLCVILRRASQRWQQQQQQHMPGETRSRDDSSSVRAAEWAALTPETWLLPQDAEAVRRALRDDPPLGTSSRRPTESLFIVKPANQAGGQGIFLLRGGNRDDSAVASAEAALAAAGALPPRALAGPAEKQSSTAAPTHGTLEKSTNNANAFVVQRYLSDPFLLQGHKFDLRLYVVVTSYDPVRLYLYREGLVRIASSPYHGSARCTPATASETPRSLADVQDLKAHLTNFTVNKSAKGTGSDAATSDASVETKWSLSALAAYMTELGYSWDGTCAHVHELLRRVFLTVTPEVRAEMQAAMLRATRQTSGGVSTAVVDAGARAINRAAGVQSDGAPQSPPPCTANGVSPFFEFFGVDVLLLHDSNDGGGPAPSLRPVLLEVNILPSLSTHYSLLDQRVKASFIADALTLVGLTSPLFRTASAPPTAAYPSATGSAHNRDATTSTNNGGSAEAMTSLAPSPTDSDETCLALCSSNAHVRDVCYTTAEEQRRSANFTRLLPTTDSAQRYASLMVDASLGVPEPSVYDAILSSWLAAQALAAAEDRGDTDAST